MLCSCVAVCVIGSLVSTIWVVYDPYSVVYLQSALMGRVTPQSSTADLQCLSGLGILPRSDTCDASQWAQ